MDSLVSKGSAVICDECRLEYPTTALFCPNCGVAKNRDPFDPIVGTKVGDRYQLIEKLGQGTSGTIYRAEHITLRRKVAVKVLHPELSRDELAIERFRREATSVGEIDNDHIVQILDFGRTHDGRLYLAMEFLQGQSLAALLEQHSLLPPEQVADILTQLGVALSEAHACGYVHRDLRPRNVFLTSNRKGSNFVKLLDFGLSKLVEAEGEAPSTSLGMTFGDPHYMSPEQAQGKPVDQRADIYSLGCIGYEALTGRPPFVGGRVFDVLNRHVNETPIPISQIRPDTPSWLSGAVMRCLCKKAEARFATVHRLTEALHPGEHSEQIINDALVRRPATRPRESDDRARDKVQDKRDKKVAPPKSNQPFLNAQTQLSTPAPPSEARNAGPPGPAAVPAQLLRDVQGTTTASPAPPPEFHPPAADLVMGDPDGTTTASPAPPPEYRAPHLRVKTREPTNPGVGTDGVGTERAASAPPDAVLSPAPTGRATAHERSPKFLSRQQSHSGLSAIWYADGEAMDGGPNLDTAQHAALEKARGNSPSHTGIINREFEPEYYEDDASRKKRWWIGGAAAVVAMFLVIFVVAQAGDSNRSATHAEKTDVPAAPSTPAAPTPIVTPLEIADADANAATNVAAVTDAAAPPAATTATNSETTNTQSASDDKKNDKETRADRGVISRIGTDENPQEKPDADNENANPNASSESKKLVKSGNDALAAGDLLTAATLFSQARTSNPKSSAAYVGLGEIALLQASYSAAQTHLREALKRNSGSARAHLLLGEAQLGLGDNDAAAASFKRALQISPDNARARNGYNEALQAGGS